MPSPLSWNCRSTVTQRSRANKRKIVVLTFLLPKPPCLGKVTYRLRALECHLKGPRIGDQVREGYRNASDGLECCNDKWKFGSQSLFCPNGRMHPFAE